MSFIIDPSSVSFSAIRADLKAFIDAAPDSQKWKDFFDSATGQLVVDLIAGLGTFLTQDVIVARRETFLNYSKNISSVVAAGSTVGYSAFRGKNAVIRMNVTPNFSGFISKWDLVGSFKDYDLIASQDYVVNAGTPISIDVIVGLIKDQTLQATSQNPASFRFTQKNVSTDVRVYLNSTEMETSERILDLINEKFAVQTNVYDSVDVKYLNLDTFTIRYNINDNVMIKYIERADPAIVLTTMIFDLGTINTTELLTAFQTFEDIESIRLNSPVFNETQFVIRGREDYKKIFRLLNTSIIGTSGRDVSSAIVELFYVRSHLDLFTELEKSNFVSSLEVNRPFGVDPPTISDPTIVFLAVAITLQIKSAGGNPTADVAAIISNLEGVLEQKIEFAELENTIEDLTYVKIARIITNPSNWAANTNYRRGKRVKAVPDNGFEYEQVRKIYTSGTIEPEWNSTIGLTTDDVCNHTLASQAVVLGTTISAKTLGTVGDSIRLVFNGVLSISAVVSTWNTANPGNKVKFSPSINGALTPIAQIVDLTGGSDAAGGECDGTGFKWLTEPLNGTPPTWSTGVEYTIAVGGGSVVVPTNTLPPFNDKQLRAISFVDRSGRDIDATPARVVYDTVEYIAVTPGANGNAIALVYDSLATINSVVNTWNAANPSNTVKFIPTTAGLNTPIAGSALLSGGGGTKATADYEGVTYTADNWGISGNSIALIFNGIQSIGVVVGNWNLANPNNTVSHNGSNGTVPVAGGLECLGGTPATNQEPLWPIPLGVIC